MDTFEIKPGFIVSKLKLKKDDTILITIDPDIYDVNFAYDYIKAYEKIFPTNNIICTFKGIDIKINAGAGSRTK